MVARLGGDSAPGALDSIPEISQSYILSFAVDLLGPPLENWTDLWPTGNSYGTFQQYVKTHHLNPKIFPVDRTSL